MNTTLNTLAVVGDVLWRTTCWILRLVFVVLLTGFVLSLLDQRQ